MLTMIAKFELAVRLRQYNRHTDKKLTVNSVYGLRFCEPTIQAQLFEACALLDFRSHERDRWSFDHIAVCLQVLLPWLQKTLRDAQADLLKAKRHKKLPNTILREADLYLRTLSRRLVTVSDRLEEVAVSYVRSWFMGSHQRLMNTSPAFFEALAKTTFAKHDVARELLKQSDDQRLPHVFQQVWEGLQSTVVSDYTYESLCELAPIQEHPESVQTVSLKRAGVRRENSLAHLLPVTLQMPTLSSWFWRSALARFLFPDRYACATFAREHAYAISLLFTEFPGLYLRHKGLLPAQEPVWKRIVAQAEALKAAIQSVEHQIQNRSRVKYRSRRLLHELKRLLQQQAHKIEVHKVKFTRMVQRGDDRPHLNPAIRPNHMHVVTRALGYLDQSVRNHEARCQILHQARLRMIALGEHFYTPAYGPAARELASIPPARFCEFNLDQWHEETQYAQLWIDQVREIIHDTHASLSDYQQRLTDEKGYHALLVNTWSKLNPSLLTFGQPDRQNAVQQLKLQFENPTPWYTSEDVIDIIDQLTDGDVIWERAETQLAQLVQVTEHPEAGLPHLHLINGHPLLQDLIQDWDTHPEAHMEQLRDVERRLTHMQVDLTLDFVPYVMSLSGEGFAELMTTLGIERERDETPQQQAYRALMLCRRWQMQPDQSPEQEVTLSAIHKQLEAYHTQLKTAVDALKEYCLSPATLIQHLHESVFAHIPDALRPKDMGSMRVAFDEIKLQWHDQQKRLYQLKELQKLQVQTLRQGYVSEPDADDKAEAQVFDHTDDSIVDSDEAMDDVLDLDTSQDASHALDLNTLFLSPSDQWCQRQLRKALLQFFRTEDVNKLFEGKLDLNQQPHVVRQRWCRALEIALQQIDRETQAHQSQLDRVTDTLDSFQAHEAQQREAFTHLENGLSVLGSDDAKQFFTPAFDTWAQGELSLQEQQHVLARYQQTLKGVVRDHNAAVATLKAAAKSMQTLLPQIDIHQLDEARQRQLDRLVNKSIEYTESPNIVCNLPEPRLTAMRDAQQDLAAPQPDEQRTFDGVFIQPGQ